MNRIALAILLLATGCAEQVIQLDPETIAESKKPLTCANKGECDLYWQRAQAYVNQHSTYRIQVINDTVLTTYGPDIGSADIAYRLTRVSNADGSAAIDVMLACDKPALACRTQICAEHVCQPERDTVNLKRYVRGF